MSGWPKVIRDPVHDVIELRDNPTDKLLFELLNTREMQRLRRIKQLGFTDFVYPGANHNRLAHSVGVMHTARKMLSSLNYFCGNKIPPDDQGAVAVMALLHDVGHGPFSHAFEKVTGVSHENWTKQIVSDPSTEVYQVLHTYRDDFPALIASMFDMSSDEESQQGILPVLVGVVSSQLDAD